jgi:hypothetical protein
MFFLSYYSYLEAWLKLWHFHENQQIQNTQEKKFKVVLEVWFTPWGLEVDMAHDNHVQPNLALEDMFLLAPVILRVSFHKIWT